MKAAISTKLKDLISQFFAYALLVAGASMVSIAVWTHAHASEPIIQNTTDIHSNTTSLASGLHINREIRNQAVICDDLENEIDLKRNQQLKILLSPNRNDPEVLEVKHRLDNEIRDLEKEIEREKIKLDASKIQENQLIARLATS